MDEERFITCCGIYNAHDISVGIFELVKTSKTSSVARPPTNRESVNK